MTLVKRIEAWLSAPESQELESAVLLLEECARKLSPSPRRRSRGPRGAGIQGVLDHIRRYPGCTNEELVAVLDRKKGDIRADLRQLEAQGQIRYEVPRSASHRLNESTRRYFPMEEQ